jgi:hypothetical protein
VKEAISSSTPSKLFGHDVARQLGEPLGAGGLLALARGGQGRDELDHGGRELRVDERVQQGQAGDPLGVADRPVKADRTAEVVHGEPELVDAERRQQAVDGALEEVEVVADADGLVRDAEPGQVRRDHAVAASDRRHHVAPEVGGGRPAVQQQHGRPVAELPIADLQAIHLHRVQSRCRHRDLR